MPNCLVANPQTAKTRDKHTKLTRERNRLQQSIDELQERESQINGELRGLRFISSCYKPWKRIRDLNEQLQSIPLIQHSPDEAMDQLAGCERDIQELLSQP